MNHNSHNLRIDLRAPLDCFEGQDELVLEAVVEEALGVLVVDPDEMEFTVLTLPEGLVVGDVADTEPVTEGVPVLALVQVAVGVVAVGVVAVGVVSLQLQVGEVVAETGGVQVSLLLELGVVAEAEGAQASLLLELAGGEPDSGEELPSAQTQVIPFRRPGSRGESCWNAVGEKSRLYGIAHPAHRSVMLTVTELPPQLAMTCLLQMGLLLGLPELSPICIAYWSKKSSPIAAI